MGAERDELGTVTGNSKVGLFKPSSQNRPFELQQNVFVAQAISPISLGPQTLSRVVFTLLGLESYSPSKPDYDAWFVSPQLAKRHLTKKDNTLNIFQDIIKLRLSKHKNKIYLFPCFRILYGKISDRLQQKDKLKNKFFTQILELVGTS
jgi:hypothetical protein